MLIDTLFRIHDTKEQNFIEKQDLIKLLYNYPDRDVFRLVRETGEYRTFLQKTSTDCNLRNGVELKGSETMDRVQNIEKRKSEFQINIDSSMIHEDNIMNLTEMVNQKSIDNYKSRGKTLGLTAQPFNIQPTTIDNKIKFIADLIFKRYGKNGRFEYPEFCQWIKLHKDFLNSFRQWFRLDIWLEYYDEITDRHLLSFHKKKPDVEGNVRTQHFNTYKKHKAYGRLYHDFFMLFYHEADTVPYKVIILKLLEVSFNLKKRKILIEHECPSYERIKILLPDEFTFAVWKKVFEEFTNDSINKKYEWNKGEIIGKGKFSKVLRVVERGSDKEYALKIIEKKTLLDEEKEILIHEASITRVLNHTNIVKLYQSIETHGFYFHVLELINGDDLYRYVSKKKFLDEYEASWIMKNLLDAIDYIHSTGIVHRDLKPENIMLEFNARGEVSMVKIIDFGLACYIEDKKAMAARCGTLNYTAPEILTGDKYDNKVDIFSLGVVMYFMIRGSLPFYSDDQYIVAKKTVEGDYEMENDDFFLNVSPNCKKIIRGMLESDLTKRITILDVMTDDWITKGETLKKYKNNNREQFDLNKYI